MGSESPTARAGAQELSESLEALRRTIRFGQIEMVIGFVAIHVAIILFGA